MGNKVNSYLFWAKEFKTDNMYDPNIIRFKPKNSWSESTRYMDGSMIFSTKVIKGHNVLFTTVRSKSDKPVYILTVEYCARTNTHTSVEVIVKPNKIIEIIREDCVIKSRKETARNEPESTAI